MAAAKRFLAEVEASSNFGFLWSHVAARSASAEIRISFPASSFHLKTWSYGYLLLLHPLIL